MRQDSRCYRVTTMQTNTLWRHEEVLFGSVFTCRSPHTWKKSIMIDPWLNITLRNCTFSAMRINLHNELTPDTHIRRLMIMTTSTHQSVQNYSYLYLKLYALFYNTIHHCYYNFSKVANLILMKVTNYLK